jgi:hypothetical protein
VYDVERRVLLPTCRSAGTEMPASDMPAEREVRNCGSSLDKGSMTSLPLTELLPILWVMLR